LNNFKRGRSLVAAIVLFSFVAAAFLSYAWLRHVRLFTPYKDTFAKNDLSAWKVYGGSWTVNDGILDNLSGARGDKAVTGSERWTDYVVETDIRLNADPADSMWGDAGLILRVTDASIGVDSYDGYYVGLGSEGSVLLLGRANYAWARLSAVPLAVPVKRGAWMHLKVLAQGCYFEATARDEATHSQSRLTYFDQDCAKKSGAAGVRVYGLPASWRNFEVHRPEP
jgi:Domain of Unknown Function (DUF1080)